MAKASIVLPTRTQRTWLPPVVVGTVVVLAAFAAWALLVRPSDTPTLRGPAQQTAPVAGQQTGLPDPAALNEPMLVVQGYLESLNRGDVAGALAAFAPGAAFTSPHCQTACVGTADIALALESTVATHGQLALTDPRVEGDTLTAHFSLASPEFPGGVQRVVGTTTAVVRNQKIVLLSMNWDVTDPQTATALNTLASTPQGTSLEQARQELIELFPSGH
jgi:SnoaL-like domain